MTELCQPASTDFFGNDLRWPAHLNVEMPHLDVVAVVEILRHSLEDELHSFGGVCLGFVASPTATNDAECRDGVAYYTMRRSSASRSPWRPPVEGDRRP
jgi:hypothetical protein